jgi:hypothetical protein
MERVSFMTIEEGDDLILSFAIEVEPGEVKSLILMRTPAYEFILREHERGVNVSHEDFPELEDEDLLRRIVLGQNIATIETKLNRYELDISGVDRTEVEKAQGILRKMNFDDAFTLESF